MFRVEKSRYFKRDGADVHTDASISLSQALLGGTIRVQGVYEDQTIQVRFTTECMDGTLKSIQVSTWTASYKS